jgi:hypothetical protein
MRTVYVWNGQAYEVVPDPTSTSAHTPDFSARIISAEQDEPVDPEVKLARILTDAYERLSWWRRLAIWWCGRD